MAGHGSRHEQGRRALACALALALAVPASVHAFEPTPGPTATQAAKVDLDLSGLEPIDPALRADLAKRIHAAAEPVVRAHSLPAEKIHLVVHWRDADAFDYKIDVVLDEEGGVAEQKHVISTGPSTEEDELADTVAANLERHLGTWQAAYDREQARRQASEENAAAGPIVESPPPDVTPMPKPRRLGKVGWTGVGLAIAGAGAMATGGALAGIRTTPDPDDATQLRDWRPAGYGLLATGGALLLTGVILVAVDASTRARARRAAVAPALGPKHVGVHLRMHF